MKPIPPRNAGLRQSGVDQPFRRAHHAAAGHAPGLAHGDRVADVIAVVMSDENEVRFARRVPGHGTGRVVG